MKMQCLYRSMLRGDIVKPGQVLDLTEAECKSDVVKTFFRAVGESVSEGIPTEAAPISAPPRNAVVAGLTRDQAVTKLRQAGAKFKGNLSNAELETLYNQTFANLAEATQK